ncbi:MAG: PilZ domain-containing protein [Acidobacteria bacterium]|nr:PilZ domain-containing protein [Acidobacteriota bacterium]
MSMERRAAPRVRINLEVSWQMGDKLRQGTISDISVSGCFILCSGDVTDGNAVSIELRPARAKPVALRGEVVNHHDEIGFAMRFTQVGKKESAFLKRLIERAGK